MEIACLHLKKTLRGSRRVVRGQPVTLARQEVWAFLLARNMIATLAARAGPLARLLAGVIAHPRNRAGRKRTSGRTPAERRTRHTEETSYTITITPSNLPQWDESLGS